MNTPVTAADRELLREVLALPADEQRSAATIRRLRSRSWSWPTIAALLQMSSNEVQTIAEGAP